MKAAENFTSWTDKYSAIAFCVFACLTYFVFFSPIIRYDGIPYVTPARSLVIDKDLNTYNESFYYAVPGWNDISRRQITGQTKQLLGFVSRPTFTTRGYRYVVFPIGSALTWYPAILLSHTIFSGISRWNTNFATDGFSLPYIIALGWWSFLIGWGGMVAAYRILRFWYSPGVSCGATLFIFASSNLIPFLTRDVTFSHSIDFLLVNLSIYFFLLIYKQQTLSISMTNLNVHILWGMLIGYAGIVRYQAFALILFPLAVYLPRVYSRYARIWKQLLTFITGLLIMIGLQLTYWKILYGTFFISRQSMGTADLHVFNPWKPQIIPMLFSNYHGLFNWMPWLLPVTIGFFLFIKRDKRIGILLCLLMASQIYFIASWSEWWNLGFSVRRITGWLIFFMIGTAEIITLCKKKLYKTALILISIPIVVWAWLFMINYQIKDPEVNVLRHLIGAIRPFEHNNYKLAIPSISAFLDAFTALKIWFWKFAMVGKIYKSIQNKAFVSAGMIFGYHLLFICICCGFISFLFSKKIQFKKIGFQLFSVYVFLFYFLMVISDCTAIDIYSHRIVQGELTPGFQRIRVNNKNDFEGENSVIPLTNSPITFEYPPTDGKISSFFLVGLPVQSDPQSVAIRVSLYKNNKRMNWALIRLGDKTNSYVFQLDRPWGAILYSRKWFRIEIVLDSSDDMIPDEWELSLVSGKDVVLGAFWHAYD
ncbi:MAG: hypothetical protein WBM02_08210 [bacterium]